MTAANKITLLRILAIPVFVTLAVYYGSGVQVGHPREWQRVAAIAVFALAAASDALDGFVARHFNQRTRLGLILDPLADKGLLLSAIVTLSFSNWHYEFPLWFPILVVSRDAVVVLGALLIHHFNGKVAVRPSWTGKTATVLQMAAIIAAMLQLNQLSFPPFTWMSGLVAAAGLLTLVSGIGYVIDGIRQLQAGGHTSV
ncbi:MAG: CDP-diacylglycerol--glycerol-3-phosphate 3-phosphatidyltransferase [Chthoniobacteraceae bacterium]